MTNVKNLSHLKNLLLFIPLTTLLVSCTGESIDPVDDVFKGEELISFDGSSEDNDKYWASNGYSNGGMFLSYWKRSNVALNEGKAGLSLYDSDKNYGSEIRTKQGYLYGYFGSRMKVFKKDGTVQSFFTYNGGQYDWDEIDIEFLGKDTTGVQFNYYDDGVGGHEYFYKLGFDASEDFHDYGFKWAPDSITWYVDFKPVYKVNATLSQWGFIFSNVWAGKNDYGSTAQWLNPYTPDEIKRTTYVDYFSYSPLED